jgi:hypothetical protein
LLARSPDVPGTVEEDSQLKVVVVEVGVVELSCALALFVGVLLRALVLCALVLCVLVLCVSETTLRIGCTSCGIMMTRFVSQRRSGALRQLTRSQGTWQKKRRPFETG